MALVEPERGLVLGHIKDTDAELAAGYARSSWGFILQPIDQDSTRLLVRCRGSSLMARLQGPVQFVMQRKMMLGIKQRAESSVSLFPTDVDPPLLRFLPGGWGGAPQISSSDVPGAEAGVQRTVAVPPVGRQYRP